jgi:hypothetical protein
MTVTLSVVGAALPSGWEGGELKLVVRMPNGEKVVRGVTVSEKKTTKKKVSKK